MDTVVGFEIVLPSGQVLNVDAKHNSDLFEGLKGGLNNFVRQFLFLTGLKFTTLVFRAGCGDEDHTQDLPPDRRLGTYLFPTGLETHRVPKTSPP